jgi:glycerol-3-phosphate dehydrogenase subunit B
VTGSVVVVGAGVAGVAAAWSARREGRDVTIVSAGAGASSLGSGAVDDVPWERLVRAARELGAALIAPDGPADVAEFSRALGLWALPSAGALRPRVATVAGRVRPARGHDKALLNFAELRGAMLLTARVPRAGWDADAIAAAISADPFVRTLGLFVEPADIPVLRYEEEQRIPDADLAARHDDSERLDWLAARIRDWVSRSTSLGTPVAGVLLGPWLGADEPRAEALSAKVGVPVGEALASPGSPAGLRFDAARDRLLRASGVRVVRDRAVAIALEGQRVRVSLERASAPIVADAAILAIGGLVGGGVVYAPPDSFAEDDLPPKACVPFSLSVDVQADVALSTGQGRALGVTSSLHGPELDLTAWPTAEHPSALETVGLACAGFRAADRIGAAGDVVAGRPRTVLEAVLSGIRAGRAI